MVVLQTITQSGIFLTWMKFAMTALDLCKADNYLDARSIAVPVPAIALHEFVDRLQQSLGKGKYRPFLSFSFDNSPQDTGRDILQTASCVRSLKWLRDSSSSALQHNFGMNLHCSCKMQI